MVEITRKKMISKFATNCKQGHEDDILYRMKSGHPTPSFHCFPILNNDVKMQQKKNLSARREWVSEWERVGKKWRTKTNLKMEKNKTNKKKDYNENVKQIMRKNSNKKPKQLGRKKRSRRSRRKKCKTKQDEK